MTLDDALFNWIQIKHVAQKRPDDQAAQETFAFFEQILTEDFKLKHVKVTLNEKHMYVITFEENHKKREKSFPAEFVHQLYIDIESEPKYNQ
jgi:hypothetical protein